MSMGEEVAADVCARVNDDVRQYDGLRPKNNPVTNYRVSANVRVWADLSRG